MQLEVAPRAEEDLRQISRYIARDKPIAAADWVRRIQTEFAVILQNPFLFPIEAATGLGFRKARVGKYLILFRSQGHLVRIERVVHGMQNLEDLRD